MTPAARPTDHARRIAAAAAGPGPGAGRVHVEVTTPGPARRPRHPFRWLERKLFLVYGPADVRDPESRRAAARPPAGGPETVRGETVPNAPRGSRGAAAALSGGTAAPVAPARPAGPQEGRSAL